MKGRIQSREELSGLPKTVHGGQAWKLEGIEDYSHNLNPFGPPADIAEIMASAAADVGHYPDDSCSELKDTLSKAFDIPPECIVIGAGSSEIIRNVPNTFLTKGDKALMCRPSFAEYAQQCRIVGAEPEWFDLTESDDFRLDADSYIEKAQGCKAVYICNPNNPTGRVEPREKLISIVRACEETGTLVFLDETLLELVPGYVDITLSGMVDRFSNLIVASSLTKSFAIPGIRIGFGFSNPDIISELDKVRMTWNVGQIEQTVANVLIRDRMDYVDKAASVMAEESEVMNSSLDDIGFPVGPVSDSFFYFSSVRPLGMDAADFKRKMLARGIMVRDCSSFGERFSDYIRYSVKDRDRNCKFIAAADSVINGRSDAIVGRCNRSCGFGGPDRPFRRRAAQFGPPPQMDGKHPRRDRQARQKQGIPFRHGRRISVVSARVRAFLFDSAHNNGSRPLRILSLGPFGGGDRLDRGYCFHIQDNLRGFLVQAPLRSHKGRSGRRKSGGRRREGPDDSEQEHQGHGRGAYCFLLLRDRLRESGGQRLFARVLFRPVRASGGDNVPLRQSDGCDVGISQR